MPTRRSLFLRSWASISGNAFPENQPYRLHPFRCCPPVASVLSLPTGSPCSQPVRSCSAAGLGLNGFAALSCFPGDGFCQADTPARTPSTCLRARASPSVFYGPCGTTASIPLACFGSSTWSSLASTMTAMPAVGEGAFSISNDRRPRGQFTTCLMPSPQRWEQNRANYPTPAQSPNPIAGLVSEVSESRGQDRDEADESKTRQDAEPQFPPRFPRNRAVPISSVSPSMRRWLAFP